jgi:hypothetical protein
MIDNDRSFFELPKTESEECRKYIAMGLECCKPESNAEKQMLIYGLEMAFWVREGEYKSV